MLAKWLATSGNQISRVSGLLPVMWMPRIGVVIKAGMIPNEGSGEGMTARRKQGKRAP
jgi:hypothetical protein